jgi:hypothetical protein
MAIETNMKRKQFISDIQETVVLNVVLSFMFDSNIYQDLL